jgi:hypothetical protein
MFCSRRPCTGRAKVVRSSAGRPLLAMRRCAVYNRRRRSLTGKPTQELLPGLALSRLGLKRISNHRFSFFANISTSERPRFLELACLRVQFKSEHHEMILRPNCFGRTSNPNHACTTLNGEERQHLTFAFLSVQKLSVMNLYY